MRILIAAGIFPPDIGGPATYAERLARYWAAQGHEVRVLCYSSSSDADAAPYTIHRISRRLPKWVVVGTYFAMMLRWTPWADIIFAQGPVAGGLQAWLTHALTRKKYVVKVTGDYAWEQGVARFGLPDSIDAFQKKRSGLPLAVRVMRSVQRRVTAQAALCIVPSMYLGTLVHGWGIPKSRIQVIYNAAPVVLNGPAASVTGDLVLSVGRLVPWKGFATLIELWSQVVAKKPSARLYIVGSGPEHQSLRKLAAQRQVTDTVVFTGKCSAEEVATYYRAAKVFVLNSGYEGLSHTILEAMSYGVPCAVSAVGGNPELIRNGESGLLFEYNNAPQIMHAIMRLLDEPQFAGALGQAGAARAASLRGEDMLRETTTSIESFWKES